MSWRRDWNQEARRDAIDSETPMWVMDVVDRAAEQHDALEPALVALDAELKQYVLAPSVEGAQRVGLAMAKLRSLLS